MAFVQFFELLILFNEAQRLRKYRLTATEKQKVDFFFSVFLFFFFMGLSTDTFSKCLTYHAANKLSSANLKPLLLPGLTENSRLGWTSLHTGAVCARHTLSIPEVLLP